MRIGRREPSSRVPAVAAALIVLWLLIGAVAAGQRGYFAGSETSCAKAGTILVTIVAGPLNYLGVNPKIKCRATAALVLSVVSASAGISRGGPIGPPRGASRRGAA